MQQASKIARIGRLGKARRKCFAANSRNSQFDLNLDSGDTAMRIVWNNEMDYHRRLMDLAALVVVVVVESRPRRFFFWRDRGCNSQTWTEMWRSMMGLGNEMRWNGIMVAGYLVKGWIFDDASYLPFLMFLVQVLVAKRSPWCLLCLWWCATGF